jgi:hypothetical protein
LTAFALAAPALADSQDFQIYKFGNPASTSSANDSFRTFANQLGVAVSSFNLMPPETLGLSGFNFALEYSAVKLDTSQSIWPTAGDPPTTMLLLPTAHVRKGLPYSFEVGGKFSLLQYSQMAAATIEVKWALNEGFFYFPDLGIRGHGTRLMGTRDFSLTTAGVDLGIGKKLALGGMFSLTPYAGWDLIYVSCISGVVDFKQMDGAGTGDDPLPLDAATKGTDVFANVSMHQNRSNRFYGGLRFVGSILELTGEVSYTKTGFGQKEILAFSGKLGFDF